MGLPDRRILLGIVVGAVSAMAVAAIGPGHVIDVMADEMPVGFDTDKLVKFDGRDYEVDYSDWVSTDPISTARVKKIEAGRVSYVDISTTSTGAYSTDGLTSPHIRYPGIEVTEVAPRSTWLAVWSGNHWLHITSNGNSFISLHNSRATFTVGHNQ